MKTVDLDTPVSDLFMVGPSYAKRLNNLGIFSAEDLLHHYPFRYQDFRLLSEIRRVQIGETVTLHAQIVSFENVFTRGSKCIQKIIAADKTGSMQVIFFNQTFLKQTLKPDLEVSLSGKVSAFNNKIAMISPEYEILKGDDTIHTGRLVPIYPETYGVSSKWLRSRISYLLKSPVFESKDWLPEKVRKYNDLISLEDALRQIHFPQNPQEADFARRRLAFDELFLTSAVALLRKKAWKEKKSAKPFFIDRKKVDELIDSLPFRLTQDQQKAVDQIFSDLSRTSPMNRLLQGDVGSGKTVVAAIASYVAFLNNAQVAYMAPTEILALQHFQTFKQLLEPIGLKIGLTTGNHKDNFNCDVMIGTHALVQNKINFNNLGLVIIDEQHRFGVEQRAALVRKGKAPHILIMTATPIPRTVALTVYGDLDLSIIEEMPIGRQRVKTWVVKEAKRIPAYNWIQAQILSGDKNSRNQAFVICPLIDPSQAESLKDIKAANDEFKKLKSEIFPKLRLGLLHGRLKTAEKEKVIKDFREKKIDVLVATPVVEVGIDIPDATIILIEGADRFGLATLHQLRGRVGRREKKSYCLLFSSKDYQSYRRLKLMETSYNGLSLAEMDLKMRGPGDVYGTAQHGFTEFKLASFSDLELIEKARRAALSIFSLDASLDNFPLLKDRLKKYTINFIEPN